MAEFEPIKTKEVLSDPKWICAMKEELVDLPHGKKPIGVKWVYKVKSNPKEEVVKHKARLVVKGFL